MTRHLLLVALLGISACSTVPADRPDSPLASPSQPECDAAVTVASQDCRDLRAQIVQADHALFRAIFDDCDPEALKGLVTDDFEFYHDKWGQIARSKAEFVKAIQGLCERQRAGTDFKGKRILVQASLEVFPMKGYGAIESGRHDFYKVEPGKPDVPTEKARFTHLWRLADGKWLLARVLSYDHVEEPGR